MKECFVSENSELTLIGSVLKDEVIIRYIHMLNVSNCESDKASHELELKNILTFFFIDAFSYFVVIAFLMLSSGTRNANKFTQYLYSTILATTLSCIKRLSINIVWFMDVLNKLKKSRSKHVFILSCALLRLLKYRRTCSYLYPDVGNPVFPVLRHEFPKHVLGK